MSLNSFTPATGLLGGCLIGLSAGTLLLFNGDILGASGLASSLVVTPKATFTQSKNRWKLCFMAAFAITTRLYLALASPTETNDQRMGYSPDVPMVSPLGFVVGGFLVGFGTRLGNGCTTGHGICGLARLSLRSFTAVVSFMATGILSATSCSLTCPFYPYLRTTYDAASKLPAYNPNATAGTILTSLAAAAALISPSISSGKDDLENDSRKIGPSLLGGALFSLGLVISTMTKSSKIYGFLNMKGINDGTWDPTLMFVMGGGFLVSFASYQFVKGFNVFTTSKVLNVPACQKGELGQFNIPTNKTIDSNLIFGEALFGLGWGFAGLCPGPAMWLGFAGYPNVLFRWWPSFFVGSLLAEHVKSMQQNKAVGKNK